MGMLTVTPAVIAEAQRRIRAQAAAAGHDPGAIIFGPPPPKPPPPQPPTAPPLPKLDDMVIPDSIISTPTVDIAPVVVQTPVADAPRVLYSSEPIFPTYGTNTRANAGSPGEGPRDSRGQHEEKDSQGWESREAWQQARAIHLEKGGTEESFEREHQKALAEKAKPKRKRKPRAKKKAPRKAKRKPKSKAKRAKRKAARR